MWTGGLHETCRPISISQMTAGSCDSLTMARDLVPLFFTAISTRIGWCCFFVARKGVVYLHHLENHCLPELELKDVSPVLYDKLHPHPYSAASGLIESRTGCILRIVENCWMNNDAFHQENSGCSDVVIRFMGDWSKKHYCFSWENHGYEFG